ncbi:MAG TPA: hypothetical protein ENN30_02020 [Candidatus Woesearchaeota archaeon]|nr:hypothetical protein [Candidatus Woesearchaeota archaeon]
MEILIGDKTIEEYFEQAKVEIEKEAVALLGKGRDTVKAVDVAELLKKEGVKVSKISIDTEETEIDGKTRRNSVIKIELSK